MLTPCVKQRNVSAKIQVRNFSYFQSVTCAHSVSGGALGTFKFVYDGERVNAQDTPLSVRAFSYTFFAAF